MRKLFWSGCALAAVSATLVHFATLRQHSDWETCAECSQPRIVTQERTTSRPTEAGPASDAISEQPTEVLEVIDLSTVYEPQPCFPTVSHNEPPLALPIHPSGLASGVSFFAHMMPLPKRTEPVIVPVSYFGEAEVPGTTSKATFVPRDYELLPMPKCVEPNEPRKLTPTLDSPFEQGRREQLRDLLVWADTESICCTSPHSDVLLDSIGIAACSLWHAWEAKLEFRRIRPCPADRTSPTVSAPMPSLRPTRAVRTLTSEEESEPRERTPRTIQKKPNIDTMEVRPGDLPRSEPIPF